MAFFLDIGMIVYTQGGVYESFVRSALSWSGGKALAESHLAKL